MKPRLVAPLAVLTISFLISAIGASFFLSNLAGKLFNHLPNNSFPGTTGGEAWPA